MVWSVIVCHAQGCSHRMQGILAQYVVRRGCGSRLETRDGPGIRANRESRHVWLPSSRHGTAYRELEAAASFSRNADRQRTQFSVPGSQTACARATAHHFTACTT